MKFLKWCFKSLIIAIFLLFITNLVGSFININVPINPYTIAITGVLRIPGIIVLIVLFVII